MNFQPIYQGKAVADLLVRNVKLVSHLTREIIETDLTIHNGRFVGYGGLKAQKTIDAKGAYACAGFIDSHIHIESSMLTPKSFAQAVIPHGTTTVVCEPHEIVNVMGIAGQHWMLDAAKGSSLRVFATTPSSVPASAFETGNTHLTATDIAPALQQQGVLGLAEVMNYPGVLGSDPEVWGILQAARGRRIDGHASGVSEQQLYAYASAGIHSDHECVTPEEAYWRFKAGMWVMVREGSAARNLKALMPVLLKEPRRAVFVTDDVDVRELLELGHMDRLLKDAVAMGLDPFYAISLATSNAAEYWGLHDLGVIAPGYHADFVLLKDLQGFEVLDTFIAGSNEHQVQPTPALVSGGVHIGAGLENATFDVPSHYPVIGVHPEQILTEKLPPGTANTVKMVAFNRYKNELEYACAYAHGMGMISGAFGSTILHDAHNLMVAGVHDEDIKLCAQTIAQMGGGVAVVNQGEVLATLPLPFAGLMSDDSPEIVKAKQEAIEDALKRLGCILPHPIMTLAFLGLTVIPKIKLTPGGLFDVEAFKMYPND